jgi:hypothetical protein
MASGERVEQLAFLLSVVAAVVVLVGAPVLVDRTHRSGSAEVCEEVAEVAQLSVPQVMALALALIALRRSHDPPRPPG